MSGASFTHSSLVSWFWIFVTFDTVNFNTTLVLHLLLCVCRLSTALRVNTPSLSHPTAQTLLQEEPPLWWMLLCFYWCFDTPHVKKILYVSVLGILSSIIKKKNNQKTVVQASSKLIFFVPQEIVLCLRCCLINAIKWNKWTLFNQFIKRKALVKSPLWVIGRSKGWTMCVTWTDQYMHQ